MKKERFRYYTHTNVCLFSPGLEDLTLFHVRFSSVIKPGTVKALSDLCQDKPLGEIHNFLRNMGLQQVAMV
jgi:hypothetical protein